LTVILKADRREGDHQRDGSVSSPTPKIGTSQKDLNLAGDDDDDHDDDDDDNDDVTMGFRILDCSDFEIVSSDSPPQKDNYSQLSVIRF
jgi:hypothetical protein